MRPSPKPRPNRDPDPTLDLGSPRPRKPVPHAFVLETLAPLEPRTRPMFGCLAVYVGERLVLFLREKRDSTSADDGVWLATTDEHHRSLHQEFPNLRPIRLLDGKITGWQNLPSDSDDFEESALRVCDLVLRRDPRIGKVPNRKPTPKPASRAPSSAKPTLKQTR